MLSVWNEGYHELGASVIGRGSTLVIEVAGVLDGDLVALFRVVFAIALRESITGDSRHFQRVIMCTRRFEDQQ